MNSRGLVVEVIQAASESAAYHRGSAPDRRTVKALGIDTVHFGVITVFNLLIGLVTPPYGLTMFLLCRIANISLQEFWRYQWPIFLTMLFALALCTVFPPLTTWLPNLVMPTK